MKPSFALSFNSDKIELHHRTAGGWSLLGDVALDAPDLGDALKSLRKSAQASGNGGLKTVLVLPEDQLLFTTCDAAPGDDGALRAALDGRTPYPVDELVFDAWIDDGTTQLAVVARQTLDEAEAFAVDHSFNPVAFSARAHMGHPVWLGPTRAAAVLLSGDAKKARDTLAAPGSVMPTPDPVPVNLLDPAPADDAPAITVSPLAPPDTRPTFLSSRDGAASKPAGAPVSVTPRITLGAAKPKPAAISGGAMGVTAAVAPAVDPDPAPDTIVPLPILNPQDPTPEAPAPRSKITPFAAPPRSAQPPAKTPARVSVSAPIATTTIVAPPPPANEAEALTVFGARQTQKPARAAAPYLAYGLTAALLLVLGGAALWMALMVSDRVVTVPDEPVIDQVAASPRIAAPEATVALPPADADAVAPQITATAPQAPGADIAALPQPETPQTGTPRSDSPQPDPTAPALLPAPDTATAALGATRGIAPNLTVPPALDGPVTEASIAPTEPAEPAIADPELASRDPREQAFEGYELTGIWTIAPSVPPSPAADRLDSLYLAALDPAIRGEDAIALPQPSPDALPGTIPQASLGPGLTFELTEDGLVTPTPEGTLSPDGVIVFAGKPPIVPPRRPGAGQPAVEPETDLLRAQLAAFRPRARPGNLAEGAERAANGGATRADLARFRPKPRPRSVQDDAQNAATPTPDAEGTLVASRLPKIRPAEKAKAVQKQLSAPVAPAVSAAAAAPAPRIPTTASVARQATVDNVINLRRVALIGVYGTASKRRALVRLPSGRMNMLKVGDRLDGGQIATIGDSDLRYIKKGKSILLELPG